MDREGPREGAEWRTCVSAFFHSVYDMCIVRHKMNDVHVITKRTESGRLSGAMCWSLGCRYEPQH